MFHHSQNLNLYLSNPNLLFTLLSTKPVNHNSLVSSLSFLESLLVFNKETN